METTLQFTRKMAQEDANSTGKSIEVYTSQRMVHMHPQGLKPLPADATDYELFTPDDNLRAAIKLVLETGDADIYYDSSFDNGEPSTTSQAVLAHQEALIKLRALIL